MPINDGIMFAAIISFSPSRRRTRSLNDDVLFAVVVSIFAHLEGVCDTPLRFSCDAETIVFSHHGLRNCFTIKDENTNGERSSAGRQWCFRDGVPWFEIRAKYIFHLRNEDCFLRKTAIATAMEVDHLAQTASAFAEMKLSLRQSGICKRRSDIVPCANAHRIYRNEIVPPTKWRRQSPKRYCPLRKPSSHLPKRNCPSDTEASAIAMGLCASWHVVHLNCDENLADGTNAIYHLAIRFIHLNKSKITWDE